MSLPIFSICSLFIICHPSSLSLCCLHHMSITLHSFSVDSTFCLSLSDIFYRYLSIRLQSCIQHSDNQLSSIFPIIPTLNYLFSQFSLSPFSSIFLNRTIGSRTAQHIS